MKRFGTTWLILAATLVSAVATGQTPPAGPALTGDPSPATAPPAAAEEGAGSAPNSYESWVDSLQPAEQVAAKPYVRPGTTGFQANDVGRIPVRIFNAEAAGGAYPSAPSQAKGPARPQNQPVARRDTPVRSPTARDLTADLNRVANPSGVRQTSAQVAPAAGANRAAAPSGPLPAEALRDLPPGAVVTDPRSGAVIGVVPGGTPASAASMRQAGAPGPAIPGAPALPGAAPAPGDPPPTLVDSLGLKALYHDGIEPVYFKGIEGAAHCMGPPEDRRFYLHGWMEQGFTINPDCPVDNQNGPVLFNDRANEYMLNQLYVYGGRRCETDGCHWDYGARVDFNFGEDSRFLSSTGLELHQDGTRNWMGEDTRFYGLAMPQLYAEMSAPVAGGLNLKVGHFYSIFGFERLTAPDSFFYSHSYARVFGMPYTHTGGLATVYLPPNIFFKKDQFTLSAGLTRGWDTWARSDGSDMGFLFGFSIDIIERRSSFSGALHVGQELVPFIVNGQRLGTDCVVCNFIYTKQLTDQLAFVSEFTGGSHKGAFLQVNQVSNTVTFDNTRWYGLNNYLLYEINSMWSAGMRLEWFFDPDSQRVARLPVGFIPGGDLFLGNSYFNLTMGLNWTPYPRVLVRPELRCDWSNFKNNPGASVITARPFDNATDGSQFLLATDVILSF